MTRREPRDVIAEAISSPSTDLAAEDFAAAAVSYLAGRVLDALTEAGYVTAAVADDKKETP